MKCAGCFSFEKKCKFKRFADLNTPFPNNSQLLETIYQVNQQFWSTETLVSWPQSVPGNEKKAHFGLQGKL